MNQSTSQGRLPNILVLSFFPAYTPAVNGGTSRLISLYSSLAAHCNITLISSGPLGGTIETYRHCTRFKEIRIPKDNSFYHAWVSLEKYSSGGDLSGPALARASETAGPLHNAILENIHNADLIIHDSPFTVGYDVLAGCDSRPRVYNAYNCELDLYRQLHPDAKSQPILQIVEQAEREAIRISSLVWTCSREDSERLKSHYDYPREYKEVPNGCAISSFSPRLSFEALSSNPSAVFIGSGHPPNQKAADFIASTIAPNCPEITFHIIGQCFSNSKTPPNVISHGVISESMKERIFASSAIAINPIWEGSGSNLKVFDYMSHGIPVLSTDFGMRGVSAVEGKDFFLATLESFTHRLKEVLANPAECSRIASSAKAMISDRYSWSTIGSNAARHIVKLIERNRAENSKPRLVVLNDYNSFQGHGGGCTRTRGLYFGILNVFQVTFICFSASGTIKRSIEREGLITIEVPKSDSHLEEERRVDRLFHLSSADIISSQYCGSNQWLASIYEILAPEAHTTILEHCYMQPICKRFSSSYVYSSQNSEYAIKSSLLQYHPEASRLTEHVRALEHETIQNADLVITVSDDDASLMAKGLDSGPGFVTVRNGVSCFSSCTADSPQHVQPKTRRGLEIVFIGSAHGPNIEAAHYIVRELAPILSDFRFHLVGGCCETTSVEMPNVIKHGIVDEERKAVILQQSDIGINPIVSGSGSNVKLADYLAHGLYVVSTAFGIRGYPSEVSQHVTICDLESFPFAINNLLSSQHKLSISARNKRHKFFLENLSLDTLSCKFGEYLLGLKKRKKKILFVTYRYSMPPRGGAEEYALKMLKALDRSGEYSVTVVSPKVTSMRNVFRFSEEYYYDQASCVPTGMSNICHKFFALGDSRNPGEKDLAIKRIWEAQIEFQKKLSLALTPLYARCGVTWGWEDIHYGGKADGRWCMTEAGIHLTKSSSISIAGYVQDESTLCIVEDDSKMKRIFGPVRINGEFRVRFPSKSGNIRLICSGKPHEHDPRPLGMWIRYLSINDEEIDLRQASLTEETAYSLEPKDLFEHLRIACEGSRSAMDISLTAIRGPVSDELTKYLVRHIEEFDLIIAHGAVFRPAVEAVDIASSHGKPSILIPHLHLEDDYYHFPDVDDSIRSASLSLTCPKVSHDFLLANGCSSQYMPAGCDTDEPFGDSDVTAFKAIDDIDSPFVLVLGRKAGAKGYKRVISAVEDLAAEGYQLRVVMIGPDDDGEPVTSPCAYYYGRQPRNVVRGALLSSLAICSMSSSESFGITLLEAWQAGKPIIANRNCPAFHDFVEDGINGMLVRTDLELKNSIRSIMLDNELAAQLAIEGKKVIPLFSWNKVEEDFLECVRRFTRV